MTTPSDIVGDNRFGVIPKRIQFGTQEISGVPEGRHQATPQQIEEWLKQKEDIEPQGRVFRNFTNHFQLDWGDIDIPDPAYYRRDKDLCLISFPEVESPYKFPESVYEFDAEARGSGMLMPMSGNYPTAFTILPPHFDENLQLLNPDVEVRVIKEGYTNLVDPATVNNPSAPSSGMFVPLGHHGVRVYTSNSISKMIPVRAIQAGEYYNVGSGKLMCAPRHWLAEEKQNSVYGPDYEKYLNQIGYGPSNEKWDDDFWAWYRWNDGADSFRKMFWDKIQSRRLPRRGEGFSMLLGDVKGLNQSGNQDKVWLDPIYLNSISKVNHHKLFREVSHCYRVDKCNYATNPEGQGGEVYLIEDKGFHKNQFAQVDDGDLYCRYRQSEADARWKSRIDIRNKWDNFCKYLGVPQRAVEYDGHYKTLLREVLFNFRQHGIFYWTGYAAEIIADGGNATQQVAGNGFKLVTTKILSGSQFQIGQLNAEEGVTVEFTEGNIPADKVLFFYTVSAPAVPPNGPDSTDAAFETHRKDSRLFAYIWIINHDNIKQKLLVELKDDYISPVYRISEFEVAEPITGGQNPFVRDKRFAGKNLGGLRHYLTKDPETGIWKLEYPYDINPEGFFNIYGGTVQLTGVTDPYAQFYYSGAKLPPVFVDVPSSVARGAMRAVGLPGEIIQTNSIFWKQPHVVKWDHIQEIYDKLMSGYALRREQEDSMVTVVNEQGKVISQTQRQDLPNHILVGQQEAGHVGRGMVSNGDTKYSDIILLSDIFHARNMALPMIAYKLTPHLPNETSEYFESETQDYATRQIEPQHLTVQRFGFKEPGIFCFMKNVYQGVNMEEDPSYTLLIPQNEGYFSGGVLEGEQGVEVGRGHKANKVFRVYHPNGMRWWRDTGLLGCGIQYGSNPPNTGWGELGAKGSGLSQVGYAVVNLFRKNLPTDKEIVKAYLRLVPSNAHAIGNHMIQTAGGGRQWTIANDPFYNMTFDNPTFEGLRELQRGQEMLGLVEYEYKLIYKEEHQGTLDGYTYNEMRAFCKKKTLSEHVMGSFNFPFNGEMDGAGKVTKPDGTTLDFFSQYDYEKTKRGHLLNNIQLFVEGKSGTAPLQNDQLAQRSFAWYSHLMPSFMGGKHSRTTVDGLGNRNDYDEAGDVNTYGGKGYGFACSSAKWAEDHRMFDITRQVQEAYLNDRFDALYTAAIDTKLADLGEAYNLVLLQPKPSTDVIQFGELPVDKRVIHESVAGFYNGVLAESATGEWGNPSLPYNMATISLEQIPPPRQIEGLTIDKTVIVAGGGTVASERQMRKNAIVKSLSVTLSGTPPTGTRPYILIYGSVFQGPNGAMNNSVLIASNAGAIDQDGLALTYNLDFPIQLRYLTFLSNIKFDKVIVNGWMTEDWIGQVPMTEPPIYETHDLSKVVVDRIINKNEGDYTILTLQAPVTKIYKVSLQPHFTSNITAAFGKMPEGIGEIVLTYKGLLNIADPPQFTWELVNGIWIVTGGQYAYSSSMNAIILPTLEKWYYDPVTNEAFKVGDIYDLAVGISYVTGRGAKATIKVQASANGPGFDVDPEAINEVTETGASQIGVPPIGERYGLQILPWSCNNPKELQGGYLQGVLPTNANGPLQSYFKVENYKNNLAWASKCQGELEVFGEPDWIIGGGEFKAPAYIVEKDPVTGVDLDNGVSTDFSLETNKIPNGGRQGASLIIRLSASDESNLYSSDGPYRKKQVAYVPEVYIYTRERVSKNLGSTSWGLNIG